MTKIAVILTVFNRKQKTLKCLKRLYASFENLNKKNEYRLDVFLVDDGSTDGTGVDIKIFFPKINIINGTGSLYWNQGMRLAWIKAYQNYDYDYYIWLNNDTFLLDYALKELFEDYTLFKSKNSNQCIVVGACSEDSTLNKFSYGLRKNHKVLVPNGKLQEGNMMNGNVVLIPKEIFTRIGYLSSEYTHAMGDHDYGLRAIEKGFNLITTKKYIAVCETNKGIPTWCNPNVSLSKRWKALHMPTGLNIKEYKYFQKRFWKKRYYLSITKVYLNCLFPNIYNLFNPNVKR